MFEIGDKVKVRLDCTIGELAANKWNKAHKDTLKFLNECDLSDEFFIDDISDRGNLVFEDVADSRLFVNPKLFEIVEKAEDEEDEDEPVEMTLDEICEELGYRVKLVIE